MSCNFQTRLALATALCIYGNVAQSPASAAMLNADAAANVSAGRNIGQPAKLITPGPGSLAVTIGAAASDSIPRDPKPGFHEYSGILTGSGSSRYGALAGRAHAEASSRPAGDFDPYGAGGTVSISLGFLDTVEVVSSTLATGTSVTLTFVMTLDAAATHFADGPFTPGRIGASARNDARIRDIEANTSTPISNGPHTLVNSSGTYIPLTTFQFDTAIGHHLEIDVDMLVAAKAIIDAFPTAGDASQGIADVIANNTAHFFYQPSGNFSLIAESGHDYVAPAIPGDYNNNFIVDAADYVIWRKTGGTPTAYNTWRTHFGQSSGSGATGSASASNSAIPEPTGISLTALGLAALALLARQRCILARPPRLL